jgi:excinuclease ABC subunit A
LACTRATTRLLLGALHTPERQEGNTLVVVEHDEDTIRRADHVIDIGPGAGQRGGRLVAEGAVADIMQASDSQTGRYLLHAMRHPLKARRAVVWPPAERAVVNLASDSNVDAKPVKKKKSPVKLESDPNLTDPEVQHWLTVNNAKLHNLQNVDRPPCR